MMERKRKEGIERGRGMGRVAREGERERDAFHLLAHCSSGHCNQVCASLKPCTVQVSHKGDRNPNIYTLLCCFRGHIVRELSQKGMCWCCNQLLKVLHPNTALPLVLFYMGILFWIGNSPEAWMFGATCFLVEVLNLKLE